MNRIMAVAAVLALLSGQAVAQVPPPIKQAPTTEFGHCDKAVRAQLLAPMDAQIVYHTFAPDGARLPKDLPRICYQARTKGGGYTQVSGTCDFDASGKVTEARLQDNPAIVSVMCGG